MGPFSRLTQVGQRLRRPIWQSLAAVGVMLCGAALIGPWMVGVVLILAGVAIGADALLRDDPQPNIGGHDNPITRYWRAP